MNTTVRILRFCSIISLIVLSGTPGSGQVNIKIGYNLAFVSAPENNAQIRVFNETNKDILEKPMGELNFMQGIALGVRYGFEGRRFIELGWDNITRNYMAVGENPNETLFREELFYSMNQFSLAYENHFDNFGLGTALVYNSITIKNEIADSDFKKTIVNGDQWAVRVITSLNFRSNRSVSLALKPFIQIPLSAVSIRGLSEELNDTPVNEEDKFPYFGVSFVFYNGP